VLDDVDPNRLDVVDVVNSDVRYDGMFPIVDIDSGSRFNTGLSPQSFNAKLSRLWRFVLKALLTAASAQLAL
jgi:hypothetical protein